MIDATGMYAMPNVLAFFEPNLDNLGVQVEENGRTVRRGGVKFTIKDGVVFDAPKLLEDVAGMVRDAKSRTSAP